MGVERDVFIDKVAYVLFKVFVIWYTIEEEWPYTKFLA